MPSVTSVPTPLPTTLQGWSVGSYGIWSLVVIQLVFLLGVIVRNGPKWLEQWATNRRMAAEDDRVDAQEKAEADKGLLNRVIALEERAQKAETVGMYLTGAVTMTLNALRTADPTNSAIPQAESLVEMALAASGDGVFAKGLSKLATVKGVGE